MATVRRILMIAPHFEEYALRLSAALAEHAEVLLVLDTSVLNAEFAGRTMPLHPRLSISHSRFGSPAELARLLVHIRRFRPDVLHWQEPSGFIKALFAAVTVSAAARSARTAVTIHDPVPHAGRDSRVAARLARLRRFTRARVDRLFLHGPACVNQYQQDYLGTDMPDPRVRLTDHGVLLPPPEPRDPPPAFRALMFGRMEAYKGLDTLADALEHLARSGCSLHVDIAGRGPEMDRLEDRLRDLPGVTATNAFVPAASLIGMIEGASCVLLPYQEASQSGVLAAAFAGGRCVIASGVGGLVDLVDDRENGLLVPPDSPAALAAALTEVAGDPALRERLSNGAARTAATRLNWDRIAAQLMADY
ncbi:glycosyltransferase family 4 protein [Sphingomonas sp. IC4-52]|uniref:glycosyltransferase family 4 protein n=1 Tax=Sphingomonas sp. IC4-52 TaxID=2887202 RepID=UPI001D129566|nr:glycosyltransferase family 4 protein [Sphingomonas sp. IC4-52]MCC2980161.1 glycosyltransferase family 4 protein [Sphingomonas sp. IC4-52]